MKGILLCKAKGINSFAVREMELMEFISEYTITGNMVVAGLCILQTPSPHPEDGPYCFICPKSTEVVETTKELLKAIKEIFP